MNTIYPKWTLLKKPVTTLFTWLLFLLISSPVFAQLGTYSFTGPGACPNQNHSVTSQPANAVFSDFTLQGIDCDSEDNMFKTKNWTPVSSVNLSEYLQFEITPSAGYGLNLTDLTFTHYVDELPGSGSTNWVLRSSIDNYSTDIATGNSTTITQTSTVNLPVGDFTSIGTVIFRIYLLNIKGSSTRFFMDEVNLNGSIVSLPADPANPTSNSPQCYTTGVTMNFSGTPPSAEAWYWQTSANGTSTANSASSYNVTSSGTYYVKARDMSTLMWSAGAGSVYVIAIPAVYTPVFDLGSSSSRCSGSSAITFSATAQYSTNISYSLDAASISGGNTINDSTGQVNFSAGWTDTSVITATATGCDASTSTADHIVTITPNVGTPVFTAGATSFRCTGSGSFTYNASATNNLGISYSLDATSLAGGVTINASTGTVTYPLNWVGVSTITASAAGCNGPAISTHQASSLNPVVTPVFSGGGSSTICQGSGRLNYSATATNAVSISYSLDATSIAGGNTINTTIGDVIYAPSWSGTSYITATATGCGGPKSATHVVTITPTVGTPVFALGTTSTRCQGATNVVYGATASNSTVITYSLDAGSTAAGNIIDATGQVTYVAGWSGSSVITATAVGCNGPTTATHTATTTATVGTPVFNMGTTSTRCQGPGTVTYTANATNSTALSYSLNAAAITAGNTINTLTGQVSYVAGWTGSTIITASAAGCNGPITAQHTVTIDLTVGSASFVLGASSSRCGGAGSITYTATATNNTGITYSLDAASIAQGNTINSSTGTVSYVPAWSGPSTITASAAGCNGPSTASHTVNMLPGVTTPVFSLGTSSVRCQSTSNVTYTATATNSTGITYSLDAASVAGGNTINSSTGLVSYVSGWSGTTIITASAAGCSGPATATHTVTITPFVGTPVFVLGANSIRCQGAVTIIYTANASNSTGINYSLDAISLGSGNTINSSTGAVTFTALWFGNSTITATATGCGSNTSATHTVTVNATVGTPVFTLGASSTRCQLGITVIYTATAANNSGITYSLDAASIAGGNTINAATGAVTYSASWTGTSTITATATGCNGPKTANHIVNTTPTVGVPSFIIGPVSSRCQGAGTATYTANASNATGMIYSLDVASITGGNSINSSTGLVTYAASWSGTTTVTATAAGCNGPKTNFHTVTITANVGNPVFTLGATSTRCQGAGTVTYTATATNNTGISYSLDAASISGGNSINSATGTVTYVAGWNGTSIIRASTTGCNGPQASNHTVTNTPTVGTPSFALGLFSSRQQGAATITYSANATNSTGITYTLDAASLGGGNTINSSTGAVTYAVNWNGTTVITASAAGCNGPFTANHTVFINPTVVGIPLYLSDPSQALDRVDPVSTGDNTTASTLNLSNTASGVVVDATSSAFSPNPGSTSFSVTHTTGAGANRLMLVGISQRNQLVTGVTYAGIPLILVGENITTGLARMHIYALVNPPSGTNSVVVTLGANPATGIVVGVTTFTGVNQSTPLGTFTGASGTGTTASVTVSSGIGESVYDVSTYRLTAMTPNASQTARYNVNSTNEIYGGASIKPGAASVTSSWAGATSQGWAIGAVSIKPDAGIISTSFTQAPPLCTPLTIKAGLNITISNYVNIVSGSMPVNPAITADLKYGGTNIITISNPTYNSGTGMITWSGQLAADLTIPAGQAITYTITTAQAGVVYNVLYDSDTKPSKINLPVSTYIDITSIDVYNAPYPGGTIIYSGLNNTNVYVRAVVTAPFGVTDINAMTMNIAPPGTSYPATVVATAGCTKTYEYVWTTPSTSGSYDITGTAYQGFENSVTRVLNFNINLCTNCPPVAVSDSARGAGGAPLIIDALANDYDPNNNINPASLAINTQPNNGSAYLSNGKIVYLPNGTYSGRDTIAYRICDLTSPTPLCSVGYIYIIIDPTIVDPCSDATKSHTYYIPYPEQDAYTALVASASTTIPSNNIRTVISLKIPYPGMTIVWDEWEDGYEVNALNPLQTTTKVWGDGNPYNGIVPGYSSDIIPAGGSIVLDNTMPANPRVQANIFYDGRDKIVSSGQISITQVSGEPTWLPVQSIKTNVTSTFDFGQSFTIPLGQNYPSRDFSYTSLFIRAAQNNTQVNIDKDNNGSFETSTVLNEGQSYLVNGGVLVGATVTSDKPVGVELNAGGIDQWSIRNTPIYPASWYSNTYYTPVPTSDNPADNPKDTSVVMLYNSLNRPINVNWSSGAPASGTITLPAKSVVRFPLAYSTTATYKFVNPTGESFTAIEIIDSYTPGGGGNDGTTYDWAFNLIAEARLTDFATVAWAPGGLDLIAPPGPDVNGNPIWVTPSVNTTVYVKYDGNVSGSIGSLSPCGLRYDVSYALNALNYMKIRDLTDNDQSGIAVYTCNGAKLAAVYGEDPQGSGTGIGVAYWDVGTTIQPFCKQKLIFANNDYGRTMVNQPVTIPILLNDFGFLAVVDPSTVNTTGLLQPRNGTVTINANGTVIYTPNTGYVGNDTFEYSICSTPTPVVCDKATVYVQIAVCPAPLNQNIISGAVFLDKNKDGVNNDGGTGYTPAKVYLYIDGNCNGIATPNELKDSVTVDSSGTYQFISYPEKIVSDDFDNPGNTRSCANGTDGNAAWKSNWVDQGDPSVGYCNVSQSQANTDAEIYKDGAFSYALRLKDRNVSATRTIDLGGASYAFLTFSYRRKSATLTAGKNVIVQASLNGSTFGTIFTIAGDGNTDANYVTIYNQDISAYNSATTYIRFLTNSNMADADTVYIDNVSVRFVKYPQCYITSINSSLIPSTYHLTTGGSHALTANNGITCLAPYDFGVARNSVAISGTLSNDANGLTDNLVNGTAFGYPSNTYIYAYLVDSLGKIAFKTQVDPANGTYIFPLADILTTYTVSVSTYDLPAGGNAPTDSNLPANWVNTGEAYGFNNLYGSGNDPGVPNGSVTVKTGLIDVTNVNFGCERLPNSDDKSASYTLNIPGTLYALPTLTGSDPEDGILGSGNTYKITSLPVGAVLYYNGVSVILNQVITNFNASLFKIDPDDNTLVSTFTYAARDAAGEYDPTPATVLVDWSAILPIKLLNFSARLNGSKVDLNWVTASEYNSDHFNVERSADGRNFSVIGKVAAKGNTTNTSIYSLVDPSPMKGLNYYRLKMIDRDGAFEYSKIVIIRIENGADMVTKIAPNPFTDKVDVYLSLTHNAPVDFTIFDMSGKKVFQKSIKGLSGLNWFTINDLSKLPASMYMLHIKIDENLIIEKLIKQ